MHILRFTHTLKRVNSVFAISVEAGLPNIEGNFKSVFTVAKDNLQRQENEKRALDVENKNIVKEEIKNE